MSRLIDADKLELDAEWSDYYNAYMAYSSYQINDAEEVKAIPLDKVKQAREEIQKLRGCSCSCSDGIIDDVEDILDELIESEDKE
jgi:hypothetical protein